MWQEMDGALRVFEMYAARAFLSVVLANDRVNIQTPVKPHILTQDKGKGKIRKNSKTFLGKAKRRREPHGEREERGGGERERSQEIKGDGKIE